MTNEKQRMVRLWSYILILTIIFNVLFFTFAIGSDFMWAIIVAYPLIAWDSVALVCWIMSFCIKYKKFNIDNNEIEVYAGFSNHYIKVNGELKDEYKSSFSFTPIKLSCLINNKKLEITISLSNNITIKFNDELIK